MSDGLTPIGGLKPIGGFEPEPMPTPPAPPPGTPRPPVTPAGELRAYTPAVPVAYREPEPDPTTRVPLYIGGAVVAALFAWGVSLLIPAPPAEPATTYKPFVAANKAFACDLPQKWKVKAEGSAAGDNSETALGDGVTARSSDAVVDVTVSSIAGLVKAQLMFGSDPIPSAAMGSRAEPIFKSHQRSFKKQFKNYKEKQVAYTETMIPHMTNAVPALFGKEDAPDLRWGEFTADGDAWGLHGKRHGYRMAVGGSENIVTVICECSERDWPKLKPGFDHVIASVTEVGHGEDKSRLTIPGGAVLPSAGSGMPGFGGSGR